MGENVIPGGDSGGSIGSGSGLMEPGPPLLRFTKQGRSPSSFLDRPMGNILMMAIHLRRPALLLLGAIAFGTVLATPRAVAAQCHYDLALYELDFENASGTNSVSMHTMNNLGQIIGLIRRSNSTDYAEIPFVWSHETGLIELPLPIETDHGTVLRLDINNVREGDDLGLIMCSVEDQTTSPTSYAVYLFEGGEWTIINPDAHSVRAVAINDLGQVCGKRQTRNGGVSYRWENGVFTDFDPRVSIVPHTLDNRGTVYGAAFPGMWFSWNDGVFTTSNLLVADNDAEWPVHVNSLGHIAGEIQFQAEELQAVGFTTQAFLLRDQAVTYFNVAGFSYVPVLGLNDVDQVLLQAFSTEGEEVEYRAVLWQSGVYTNLASLYESPPGIPDILPFAINDHGQLGSVFRMQEDGPQVHFAALLTPRERPLGDVD